MRSATRRPGITLIELLVVVTILLMVAFVALPALAPSKEGRQVREAARSLNVMFGAARAQAMETGRSVGVWFERLYGQPQVCLSVFPAEIPPSYSGDDIDATLCVRVAGLPNNPAIDEVSPILLNAQPATGVLALNRISGGDLIRFNQQGPYYQIQGNSQGAVTSFPLILLGSAPRTMIGGPIQIPWSNSQWSSPLPFEVVRQPVRSAGSPLEMPAGIVVELGHSGTDSADRWFSPLNNDDMTPLVIMFSPSGSVEKVYCRQVSGSSRIYGSMPVHERLYLLIGQRKRPIPGVDSRDRPVPEEVADSNLGDSSNIWLTINATTGLVSSREMENLEQPRDNSRTMSRYLWWARRFARSSDDIMGGK